MGGVKGCGRIQRGGAGGKRRPSVDKSYQS